MSFNPDVRGADVSYYQDSPDTVQQIDFARMRAAGASFVIIRAGQRSWIDPDLTYNLIEARKAGLPTGAYFFYDSRETPEKQADLFLSLTKGITLELGIWLDLEENYQGTYKGWQNWKKCLMRLKANTPDVGIYTAPSYWMTHRPTGAADLAYFKSFPLWIANYNVSTPIIPGPWDYAILWQMGTPAVGLEYGVESLEIDMNYWNGSPESFRAYFGLGVSEPETGESMSKWYRVTASVLNIRNGPGASYVDVGDLLSGDLIEVIETIGGWHHVDNIWRGGALINTPAVAWCSGAYTVLAASPLPPPVEPPAELPARVGLVYEVNGVVTVPKWYAAE
jgi:lysozyme